ncbi:unnamed protein product, partial [Durusdinium trenchii]
VPKGCFVGVRVGEVLKQRRLDSRSASYTFPKPDTKMNAKIDVYQHVGSGSVVIDPKFFTTDEVSIRCHDVLMQNIRLQVTSQVAQASAEEQCQRRQAAQEENKESALTYLTVHGIEQTLAESVRRMLTMQPEGRHSFLLRPTAHTKVERRTPSSSSATN